MTVKTPIFKGLAQVIILTALRSPTPATARAAAPPPGRGIFFALALTGLVVCKNTPNENAKRIAGWLRVTNDSLTATSHQQTARKDNIVLKARCGFPQNEKLGKRHNSLNCYDLVI